MPQALKSPRPSAGKPNLFTSAGRERLATRREPYWHGLGKNRSLGFRRLDQGGTWVARYIKGDQRAFNAFAEEGDMPEYDDAEAVAKAWFNTLAGGDVPIHNYTVQQALDDYVTDVRVRKNEVAAKYARRTSYKHIVPKLGATEVRKISTPAINKWLAGLVREGPDAEDTKTSKDSANRVLKVLKAALTLAWRNGIVESDSAWRRVKAFRGVGRARDVFLTLEQGTALQDACSPPLAALVRSGLLTGARLGELTARTVADFDAVHGLLLVRGGKTGARNVTLSDEGIAHFKTLAKGKLPAAPLHVRAGGKLWNRTQVSVEMRAAVKLAELPSATCFYTLRHTHASRALLDGVLPQVLAENMGTSVLMIEKHYGKFRPSDKRAMFNAVKLI